jgi:hypothetical protein
VCLCFIYEIFPLLFFLVITSFCLTVRLSRPIVHGLFVVPYVLFAAMRRRFEKRVYIPLPEAPARTTMFKLNLGDTPHSISEPEFQELGRNTEVRDQYQSVCFRRLSTVLQFCRSSMHACMPVQ